MASPEGQLTVREIGRGGKDRRAFVEVQFTLNRDDPHWIPPLKDEVLGLLDSKKNPWFEHAEAAFFLAMRGNRAVGRISAHVDHLVAAMPEEQGGGPGIGNWGLFEAEDAEVAARLIETAEAWLREKGMTRSVGPFSLSIWDEPGLLVMGHDHAPTVMMGHHKREYQGWVEAAGYAGIKDLFTYELDITQRFPLLVERVVSSGERNSRIRVRQVKKSNFASEATLILGILNDAWGNNWGYVPLTDSEIAYAGKKLKPIVFEDLIMVAEVDGEPVAFMMTLPDLNEMTKDLNGSLFPFGFIKLLWRLRKPRVRTMRVPLMGVVRRLQATRLASQLAFMMIEYIRQNAHKNYGATRSEIGWILENNQGMRSIAETIDSRINKVYRIYAKEL